MNWQVSAPCIFCAERLNLVPPRTNRVARLDNSQSRGRMIDEKTSGMHGPDRTKSESITILCGSWVESLIVPKPFQHRNMLLVLFNKVRFGSNAEAQTRWWTVR